MTRTRRRARAVVAAALGVTLAVSVLSALPSASAAPAATAGLPTVNKVAADSQCRMGFGRAQAGSADKAKQLMAGYADLGEYGHFHLAANPNWKPVSTLDSSGKGYMHALHYLLPLLRVGVRHHDTAMIDRFYFLVHDWFNDNKPGGKYSNYAWGPPIYEGFRSLVLVCAAAGPRGNQTWLRKALVQNGEMAASSRRYEGVNNASLHQQMGLYAIAVTLGRPAWRKTAIARIAALAVRLIHTDGSVEEGALNYAVNDYGWFLQAAERMRRAGDPAPSWLSRVAAIPGFIAEGTRPDGRIEALGDSSPSALVPARWTGTAAEWSATNGAVGAQPSSTFASYAAGFVFGRSGWGSATRPYDDETFYSIRAGQASGIPHAHDDSGSLTLYSHGSELLYDTGQWRYIYGKTRQFIVSRAAHNVVLVNGVGRTNPRPALTTTQAPDLDLSTVVDRGYPGVTLTRTVAYDRADDVILVWDRLSSAKAVTASQQWGLGKDRKVELAQDTAHSTGPGANVSMFFTSGGAPLDVRRGAKSPSMRGWNSEAYGDLSPAPSLRATQKGSQLSWLTVIAPRAADVPASAYSAASSVSGSAASVVLNTPSGSSTVTLDGTSGSRTLGAVPAPQLTVAEPIVLANTAATVLGNGLAPSAPVTLEALPTGATEWTTVASGTASQAGTTALQAPVPTTEDLRLVSGGVPSAPVNVIAAVAPQPPTNVVARPTGHGQVTVTWTPPTDTGGAPLTRFAVQVGSKRVFVPASAGSAVFGKVLAGGPRPVAVRAWNAVAGSAWGRSAVTVPAYPTIAGPSRARKGSLVRLTLSGLLPHQGASLRITTVSSGKTVTRSVTVSATKGTAVVSLRVRSTVRVVAVTGGVRSAAHRIGVPTH
jgi:hypothetical protein